MTKKPFRNVDELLVRWAAEHERSPDQLQRLSDQVDESLANDRVDSAGYATHRFPVRMLVLSVAAVVMMVVGLGWWILQRGNEVTKPIASSLPANPIDAISFGQRMQKQDLLAELDRMFEGKRVWFAETESDVVLGGDSRPAASDIAAEHTVAMRLVLAKRSPQQDSWQRVWSADVVSRTDQVVQFASREMQQLDATYTAWAHLLPDGLVACDVDLKWNDGIARQLSDSLLLSPGRVDTGASINVDGVEYRLFHSVTLLNNVAT